MRPKRAPHMPTQAEGAAHEITHEPCRDWCRTCVAGRGLADKHVQSDHSEVALPTVAFNCGCFGDREEECSPIFCKKDRDPRQYYGILMPCIRGRKTPTARSRQRLSFRWQGIGASS